jgi:pre-mycofactocin synthase
MIAAHAPHASTCEAWEAINAIETAADQAASPGRPRVRLTSGKPHGSDVVKALALGARGVMSGRAVLWGLAANGQAGVANVLEILRSGIDETLVGLGHASIDQLSRNDLLAAESFRRSPLVAPQDSRESLTR